MKPEDRQAIRVVYLLATEKDAFEDRKGKSVFTREYTEWLENRLIEATKAGKIKAFLQILSKTPSRRAGAAAAR